MTPLRAIRQKCVDCCAGQLAEVRFCPCSTCPLWPYRMGHRPTTTPQGADGEKVDVAPDFSPQNEREAGA